VTPVAISEVRLFWIVIGAMVCFVIGWIATFFSLSKRDDQIKALLMDGNLIRLLTVIFVVFATTVLAVMGALSEAVSAIFAGIVGYVLGSMGKSHSDSKPNEHDSDRPQRSS
jgi:Ca2+/Na+ antiporter